MDVAVILSLGAVSLLMLSSWLKEKPNRAEFARLEMKVDAILKQLGISEIDDDLKSEVQELLKVGRKMEAISVYRKKMGAGLPDARAYVEGID